jgi:ABC-type branched-subunit amino acid transport system ATPase component
VVSDVSTHVVAGEIVGIIGPNGAGKTTLLDMIAGSTQTQGGSIHLGDVDCTTMSSHLRARGGLGRTFQNAALFPTMSTTEVLALAVHSSGRSRQRAVIDQQVLAALQEFGLTHCAQRQVKDLSTGMRRVLELACLIVRSPRFALLDEPAAGLSQREVEALGELMVKLHKRTGMTIMIIEHDVALLASIATTMIAMDRGCIIAYGTPSQVQAHPAVIEAYLGTDPAAINRSNVSPASYLAHIQTGDAS